MLKVKNEITSLELVEQINIFRMNEGTKSKLLHKNLMAIIRDEFQEEITELKIQPSEYKDKTGRKLPMFILTLSQAKQVLVRESKFVRRAVINYIEELEQTLNAQQTLPITTNSIMIPLDKASYWARIRELSDEAEDVRREVYYKLSLLTKMATGITNEIDKLSDIVFETEHCINKIEGRKSLLEK